MHEKQQEKLHPNSYISFLCKNVLGYQNITSELDKEQILPAGNVHMKYYLHDTLIAIGVADITPTLFHSMYFFYDTRYRAVSIGVVSALLEIEYIQTLSKYFPEFHHYNMGYYI